MVTIRLLVQYGLLLSIKSPSLPVPTLAPAVLLEITSSLWYSLLISYVGLKYDEGEVHMINVQEIINAAIDEN